MITQKKLSKPLAIVFIGMLSFGAYLTSLSNGYALDDYLINASNPNVKQGLSGIDDIFTTSLSAYEGKGFEFRPVATTTFAIEQALFGENPQVSHFINLLIYTAIGVMLFLALIELNPWDNWYWAFVVTVVFAIHPLHTEVVNNLKNRDELLAFLFAVMALRGCIRYLRTDRWFWLLLAALSFATAVFSKVSAVPMVIIIPFTLWFVDKATIKKAVLIFAALFSFGWLRNIWMNVVLGGNLERSYAPYENPLFFSNSIMDHLGMAFDTLAFYVKMLAMPYPLVSYYGYNQGPTGDWVGIGVIMGALLFLLFTGVLVYRRRKRDRLNLGICILLLALFPYSNLLIPAPGIVAERFAFIAVLGLGFIISHWLDSSGIKRKWVGIPIYALCGLLLVYNNLRSQEWHDSLTLFEADVERAPDSAKLHYLLAQQYIQAERERPESERIQYLNDAIVRLQKATEIDATFTNAFNELGLIYYNRANRPDLAIPHFNQALQLEPDDASIQYNLASCFRQIGDFNNAVNYFAKSIENGRTDYLTHSQLSEGLLLLGRYDELILINENASFENAKDRTLSFLGTAYLRKGDTLRALANFEKALLSNPQNIAIKNEVARLTALTSKKP